MSMIHFQSKTAAATSVRPSRVASQMLCWCGTLLAVLLLATAAVGQTAKDYKMLPMNPSFVMVEINPDDEADQQRAQRTKNREAKDNIRNAERTVSAYLEGKAGGGEATLERFMREYVFARMTDWKTPGNLSLLGEMRAEFFKDYVNVSSGAVRQRLINTVTLPIMQEIIDDQSDNGYHPAVRLNAVVLLGMLDARDGDRNAQLFPVPSPTAANVLASIFTDPKYEAFLKTGAVSGLARHLQVGRAAKTNSLSDASRTAVANQALAILNGSAEGQENWDPGVNYWLQRRSIQCLGLIGQAGNDAQVVDAIVKQIKDDKQRYWLRFDGMTALGQIDLRPVDNKKLDGVSIMVIEFVAKSLAAEAAKIDSEVKDLLISNVLYNDSNLYKAGTVAKKQNRQDDLGGGIGGLDGGDEGGGGAADKKDQAPKIELPTYYLNASRQRVKTILYTAKTVLQQSANGVGLASVIDEEEKEFLRGVAARLEEAMSKADVGITNLDLTPEEQEELDAQPESYTQQMANAYRQASTVLMAEVKKLNNKAEAAQAAEDAAAAEKNGGGAAGDDFGG